ncbi:MAG TPA: (Fe-S)-binding protein [Prolixibacteraceae bacterium]|nr:(Fe-S)-binding protein [Prolixibacteraceae bacterium]
MEVALFIPCFIDQLYPKTAQNCVDLLEAAGCSVSYNPEQTCCGQPSFNSGYWGEAKSLAKKFLNDFNNDKIIVSPSASCAGFIKNYYHKLIETDHQLKQRSLQISSQIVELSDFLVNQLKVTQFGTEFNHKVTFHDSCAGLREYGIKEEPRLLLKGVKGLELIEMADTTTCCGFGGTFAAKFHHISTSMTAQKVENAVATGAEFIVSTEASCLMNMEGYIKKQKLGIRTIHLVDALVGETGAKSFNNF